MRRCQQLLMLSLLLSSMLLLSEPTPVWANPVQEASQSVFVQQPQLRPNPIARAPLVAIVEFETKQPVKVVVEVSDGVHQWKQPGASSYQESHAIPVMGFRPDRLHHIRVHVQTEDRAEEVSEILQFKTEPLPSSFPPIETIVSVPEEMEPGVTFFAANFWNESTSMLDYGYIIAVDAEGEVVWFCHTGDRIADMRFTEEGNLLYQHGSYRYAYEIDLLGRDRRRWVASNLTELPRDGEAPVKSVGVPVDTMHHDFLDLPNGNKMTLATELRKFLEFPTSEFEEDAPWAPAYVVCDRVVEFDSDTGQIVDEMHLKNVLDPRRFGYMALSGFWKDKYNHYINNEKARDWSHANALSFLPNENAILVSFRHQDCVMKIDWETKQIVWILGTHDNWGKPWQRYLLKPVGDLQWFYHQHAPQLTSRGTIMIYDNGNYRASPFQEAVLAPDNQSRVVEYRIDEQNMTVEQVYEYAGTQEDRFYCPFYCEADLLAKTENILVTDGGHIELKDGTPDDDVPADRQWARIFELTPGPNPKKVFELELSSPIGSQYGWSIYRSIRRPDLHSGLNLQATEPGDNERLYLRERHVQRENPRSINF